MLKSDFFFKKKENEVDFARINYLKKNYMILLYVFFELSGVT